MEDMEINKTLVTRSDGYIGSVLVKELMKDGYEVIGLDALFFKNIILGFYKQKYFLIKKDIRHITDLNLKDFDAVIYLAALSNDPTGE